MCRSPIARELRVVGEAEEKGVLNLLNLFTRRPQFTVSIGKPIDRCATETGRAQKLSNDQIHIRYVETRNHRLGSILPLGCIQGQSVWEDIWRMYCTSCRHTRSHIITCALDHSSPLAAHSLFTYFRYTTLPHHSLCQSGLRVSGKVS